MAGYIPWNKVDIWLQGYRSIWLSTTRSNGRPHCVPVWYWWDSEHAHIYIVIDANTIKNKNILHQSWVVLNAGNADDTIILQGNAHPITDPAERQALNTKWQTKYVDPYSGAKAIATGEHDAVYRIDIEHIMAWEYGSIQTRTDWYFEQN